jgi:peptidoglycan/LPS O-acetylase OafA/YrhL
LGVQGYRPQLDSLRAVAVAAVLYCHFWSIDTEFAELGVRLFFVLSGFLLTGILLRESDEAQCREIPQQRVLFDFYVRRILRIWPAYYFALIAAVVLGATSVERTLGWHAVFASNILYFVEQDWYPVMTGHLWTLSVEEQFYFVLPLAVLFSPRRILKPLLIGSIAAAVLFRGIICLLEVPRSFYLVLPIAQLDALAGGALLALIQFKKDRIRWVRLFAWSLPLAILADIFAPYSAVHFTITAAIYVIAMAALISGADAGIGGWPGKILSSRALVTLGRISYGIYLYHMFVAAGADSAMVDLGRTPLPLGPVRFIVLSSLTVAVAAASWLLLERPALSLRRHFRHAMESSTLVPAAPTSA